MIEVGAGTGSATASVLPQLPEGQFDYMYTDISAGFFAEAESRFGDGGGCIEYRPLDIEKDPIAQGFDAHAYDLIIASNVLHATRYLDETLGHCLSLLAPSGQLVALENLRGQGWMDLTFGQLDGGGGSPTPTGRIMPWRVRTCGGVRSATPDSRPWKSWVWMHPGRMRCRIAA